MARVKLNPESEKALLKAILEPGSDLAKFKTVCELNPSIFGETGSAEQRQVQKQRACLLQYLTSNFALPLYSKSSGEPQLAPDKTASLKLTPPSLLSPPKLSATTSFPNKLYLSPPPRNLLSPTTYSSGRNCSPPSSIKSSSIISCCHQEEAGLKLDESGLRKCNLYTKEWRMNPEGMHLTVVWKLKWITPLSPSLKSRRPSLLSTTKSFTKLDLQLMGPVSLLQNRCKWDGLGASW
jgi:hypothetical protein